MPDVTYNDHTEATEIVAGDSIPFWKTGSAATRRILFSNFVSDVYDAIVAAITSLITSETAPLASALDAVEAGVAILTNVRVYTSNNTWTKPSNLHHVVVEVVGGGGAGGGVAGNATANFGACGNGGGGGEYGKKFILAAALGATVAVTIGAGGTNGGGGDTIGGNGGTSSFGAHVTALGGSGGNGQTSALRSTPSPGSSGGGAGGTGGTGGDIYVAGNPASWGIVAGSACAPSKGGGSFLSGDTKSGTSSSSDEDGLAGVGYGSGGSGARVTADAGNYAGGNGAAGVVIVHEYTTL